MKDEIYLFLIKNILFIIILKKPTNLNLFEIIFYYCNSFKNK